VVRLQQMYSEDTPRSDFGGTPRDDRFYTPRGIQTQSSSDEWQTPRNGPPQAYNSDGDYGTPREVFLNGTPREFKGATPRDYKGDKNDGYGYVVPDPHNYWNGVASDSKHQEQEEEDEAALGLMEGVSEQDVEDIFSYARHGRCNDLERLLDRGIPLNVRDEYGNTLLTIACQNGNKKVAKLVLRRGADINSRNHKGNTPLHYCFQYGYGDTLGQYLMAKGADSSIRNNAGRPCWDGI
jgi:hypothetical protein